MQIQQQDFLQYIHALMSNNYTQTEALISLNNTLDIQFPLPSMRGWAISPDFGLLLVTEILRHKPNYIVELGSGVSSLLAGYALQRLGKGSVLSIDHSREYADKTQQYVQEHGLDDIVTVAHAPLVSQQFDGVDGNWQWYNLADVNLIHPIDLLVIDGPPGNTQPQARFPALPALYEQLNASSSILLDDASRPDETQTVQRWMGMYSEFSLETKECEKGAVVLRRS